MTVPVRLTRDAFDALERTSIREGISRTDVVNRAVRAYDAISAGLITADALEVRKDTR